MPGRALALATFVAVLAMAPGCNCSGVSSGTCARRCDGDSAAACVAGERCVSGCCACRIEVETCDGLDQNCNRRVDEGLEATCACAPMGPGASDEICNGIDDDCDETIDEEVPTAAETCNGLDDDCNGEADDGLTGCACSPGGPGMGDETCNEIDDDCDGTIDDGLAPACACAPGEPGAGTEDCDAVDDDCDDTVDEDTTACACAPDGAGRGPETCNTVDDDCNGIVDDGTMICGGTSACACAPGGPGMMAELCNGLDDDCNGAVDDGLTTCACTACGASGAEVCNALDDDCDGTVDDGLDAAICACAPGGPGMSVEVCNRRDDDCDGMMDEISADGGTCGAFGDPCDGNVDCSSQLCVGDSFEHYCTEPCTMPGVSPGDCGVGYRCWDNPSAGGSDSCRRNYTPCAHDADCTASEACVPTCSDVGTAIVTECRPALPSALPAASACTRDSDCRSGECTRTGICADLCQTDVDCVTGYRCVRASFTGCGGGYVGRCYDACDCDTECPAGQLCQPFAHAVVAPTPATAVGACDTAYGPLAPGDDCDNSMSGRTCAHAICSRGGTGFCTQVCSATCGCPTGIGPCGPSTITFGGLGSFPAMTCGTM